MSHNSSHSSHPWRMYKRLRILPFLFLIPPIMATINTPAEYPLIPAPQPAPVITQPRPLRREGAIILSSPEECTLEEAMLRSSPEPEASETLLGKRPRDNNDGHESTDTEPGPEDGTPATSQSLVPTISNVTAATLRYATQKRLRTE